MAQPLRILVADDNPAILDMVKRELHKDFTIAGMVLDGTSVLSEVAHLKPDLIVLDISMGDLNGLEVARRLKTAHCKAKIVFLTVYEQYEIIREALDAGASGYVFKSRLSTDLRAAIEAIRSGKVFIPAAPVL